MSVLLMKEKLLLKYSNDVKIILVVALCFSAATLGHFLSFPDNQALPIWPLSGVAFAMIMLLGRSSWPGITIGTLMANLLAYWSIESASQSSIILLSGLVAFGQTLEALTGNFLLKLWVADKNPFGRTIDTFQFLFVGLLISMIGASAVTAGLYLTQLLPADQVLENGLNGWVSRVVGILLFTSFILAITHWRINSWSRGKVVEGLAFILCLSGVYFLVMSGPFQTASVRSLPYLLIPFLLWLAFRFDLLAAISITLGASLLALYFTIHDLGPFILGSSDDSMLLLQVYIGVISVSTLVLSATVAERSAVQQDLKKFNANLEAMVQERTKALNEEINSRKNAEANLIKTNDELSKRNTELDNFVYSVSHDLRAPIASILGLINLAKQDKNPEMKAMYLDKMSNSARQQDNFIREILDHSRNSRLEVKREPVRFKDVIDDTFEQLKFATTTGKSVKKIVEVNQENDFYTDHWRLKVVLNNLLSNAIRYRNGRDPVIKINVKVDQHLATVEIADNGRGIASEHLENVCKMFYRATDEGAGSGLGLYIVKETIDKLNGSLHIESEEGKGTTVKIEIPELVSL
jgi:signal transduction histidine kinase